jgi:hypothetical protein
MRRGARRRIVVISANGIECIGCNAALNQTFPPFCLCSVPLIKCFYSLMKSKSNSLITLPE